MLMIFPRTVVFCVLFFLPPRQVGHLSPAHLAFFTRWDRTIDLEAKIGEQVTTHQGVPCVDVDFLYK